MSCVRRQEEVQRRLHLRFVFYTMRFESRSNADESNSRTGVNRVESKSNRRDATVAYGAVRLREFFG